MFLITFFNGWYGYFMIINNKCIEQVSIPSQRRYVGYWEDVLSFPRGINQGLPNVNLPKPWSRELRRIRLHDLVDTDSIFFVVSELQEVNTSQRVEF